MDIEKDNQWKNLKKLEILKTLWKIDKKLKLRKEMDKIKI
jgi:hypothetical protein